MKIARIYVPSVGQPDAVTRAATLGAGLASNALTLDSRYSALLGVVPAVILDGGHVISAVVEPTTVGDLVLAENTLKLGNLPTTAVLTSDLNGHSANANSHGDFLTQSEADILYSFLAHTHAGGPGVTAGVFRKLIPQTMTSTSQTAVTDMTFPIAANSTYFFNMNIVVPTSTGTSPTTAWGFTGPAGCTLAVQGKIDTSTSVQTTGSLAAFGNFAASAQVANSGAYFQGIIISTGTAGNVQLTAARGGTSPNMSVGQACNGFWIKTA